MFHRRLNSGVPREVKEQEKSKERERGVPSPSPFPSGKSPLPVAVFSARISLAPSPQSEHLEQAMFTTIRSKTTKTLSEFGPKTILLSSVY